MPNLLNEQTLSLNEATKVLPALDGRRVSIPTLWRWCVVGVRGIRLEHTRVGRRLCTSREALARFADRLAEAGCERAATVYIKPDRPRTTKAREAEIARAEREWNRRTARKRGPQ